MFFEKNNETLADIQNKRVLMILAKTMFKIMTFLVWKLILEMLKSVLYLLKTCIDI